MRHRRTLLLLLTVCAWIPTVAVGQSDCGVPFLPSLPVGLQAARTLSAPVAPAPPSFVGDQRTFFTHIPDGRSLATLRLVSEHAAFWVDNRYLSVASDAKLRDLAREFDTVIYPQNRAWFGSEWLPGIDGDYRVVILLHDVEANESAAGFGGYVSQVDTRPDAPISNVREMLYLDVFAVRDYEWFRFINLVAHEFNHLLNWYQRGGRVDERWLEEGRGTFAEWAIYGNLHQSFNEGYLSNPSRSLIAENSLETWYGGSFLLLLYLHDQYGGRAFAEALSRSPYRGIEAIDDALTKAGNAIRFEDALAQWSLANLLNNRALTARGGYQNLAATNKVPASQVIRRQAYPVSTQTQVGQWGARYVELSNFPGASLSVSVNGEHADSFRVNVWRPSRRTYQTMRVTNGVAQQSLNDLAAGESITLVLNSSVDQTLSVSATATNGNNGSLLPAARDAIDPTTTPMRVNDLLPTARRGNAAWQPLGDLPFGATTGGIALSNNDLWVTTGWGLLRFDRTNSAELRFVKAFPTEGVSSGILADTDLVIVAQGDGGVMLLNPRNNAVMSSFRTGGNATKLARRGDWLFILNGDSGLRLYNIADPENPQFVTSVFAGGGLDLLADGDRLYVTDRANGFRIFDISNLPNFPALGQANAPIQALFVHRGLVWGGAGRLVSLNLNNLNDIVVGVDFSTASSPMAIQRRENVLIVAEREAGIGLIDVSVPASPKTLAHLPTRGEAYALATEGDWVYIADGYGGIAVANVALPTSPVFTSRVSMGGFGRGVDVAGGFAFVSTENGGVVIAEALNLARVRTVGVIPTRGGARAVAVGGSVAYVASSVGVESADISDPTAPTLAVSFPTADPAADLVLSADGNTLFVAAGDLYLLNVQGGQLALRMRLPVAGYASSLAMRGTTLVVGALEGGVVLFDVSNPANPTQRARFATNLPTRAVAVGGTTLYIGAGETVFGVDVSDAANPVEVGRWDAEFDVRTVAVGGTTLFVGGETTLAAWDVADPASPRRLGIDRTFEWIGGIALGGDKLLVADADAMRLFRRTDDGVSLAVDESALQQDEPPSGQPRYANALGANFPNPSNPETWIPYSLAEPSRVSITLYDLRGNVILRMELGAKQPGSHVSRATAAYWDGENALGERVAAGVYLYHFLAEPMSGGSAFIASGRIVIAR